MICRIYTVRGATLDQYDEVDRKFPDEAPEGAHLHVAGMTDDGLKVIEVWDSEDHVNRFMGQGGLREAMQEAQLPEPDINQFEVHKLDWVRP